MAGREFPLPLCSATDVEGVKDALNELILFLMNYFSIEDVNGVTTYESGWSDGSESVEFGRDPLNRVYIRGFAAHAGPTPPEKIFTLPADYRPGEKITQWNGDHVIEVRTDGTVYFNSGTWGTSTNLTGITYFAEG
jgi:hypothetical protein